MTSRPMVVKERSESRTSRVDPLRLSSTGVAPDMTALDRNRDTDEETAAR